MAIGCEKIKFPKSGSPLLALGVVFVVKKGTADVPPPQPTPTHTWVENISEMFFPFGAKIYFSRQNDISGKKKPAKQNALKPRPAQIAAKAFSVLTHFRGCPIVGWK